MTLCLADLAASIYPIEVRLTGGKPWWHELIGPVLLSLTAVAAAAIAAKTANSRQAAQLASDSELQSKLQSERLAYDREQRNRQHIRDTVDEAMRGVDSAFRIIAEYEATIVVNESERTENRKVMDDDGVPLDERSKKLEALSDEINQLSVAGEAVYDAGTDLLSENLRLAVRLGKGHPIVKSHGSFHDAYSKRHETLKPLSKRPITDDDRSRLDAENNATSSLAANFLERCREWFEEK